MKISESDEQRGGGSAQASRGKKRHIVVGTLSLVLIVAVHSASIPDGNGSKLVLQKLLERKLGGLADYPLINSLAQCGHSASV